MTADDVLEALRASTTLRPPAHEWLYNVKNRTGYSGGVDSYADALVVSVWPSRGIWIAGVEVKVSRGDWLRELKKPAKAEQIAKYCDYWWIAAPEDVVKLEEIPVTWGLYEVKGKKAKVVRQAPKAEPENLTKAFVASMLRLASAGQERARQAGLNAGIEATRKEYDVEATGELKEKRLEAEREWKRVKDQLEWKERDYERLVEAVRAFELAVGMEPHTIGQRRWDQAGIPEAAVYRAALLLHRRDLGAVVGELQRAAEALKVLADAQQPDAG